MEQKPKRVFLYNKKTQRYVLMGSRAANMLAEKYQNEFEIREAEENNDVFKPDNQKAPVGGGR